MTRDVRPSGDDMALSLTQSVGGMSASRLPGEPPGGLHESVPY